MKREKIKLKKDVKQKLKIHKTKQTKMIQNKINQRKMKSKPTFLIAKLHN